MASHLFELTAPKEHILSRWFGRFHGADKNHAPRLRLCLDVEVRPRNQNSTCHGMPGLWELIDSLPASWRPHGIRGDCNYGSQGVMAECEARGIPYLFKLSQSAKVKTLLAALEQKGGWVDCGQGFEGIEGELQLTGWNRKRRVIVARRRVKSTGGEAEKTDLLLLSRCGELSMELVAYEYIVLVTTMPFGAPALLNADPPLPATG